MIRVGTSSWTEKTLVQSSEFYPRGVNTAEERLRFYAGHFSTVEVDATYYAIPPLSTPRMWAERTPGDFVFHVKAYGALTGHGVDPRTLPPDIRQGLSRGEWEKNRVYIKDPGLMGAVAERFREMMGPLKRAGKLGVAVFQLPPWVQKGPRSMEKLTVYRDYMKDTAPVAVEFRHGSWLAPESRQEVLGFLEENGFLYVTADEPQCGSLATVPFVPEATGSIAYFRFHGRNRQTWLKKGIATAERFKYEYSEEELRGFVPAVEKVQKKSRDIYVMFNNCYAGMATRNAGRMKALLRAG
ncbi:MAG: DUF72 domain-containing protein [Nitrospirota bacterium]|jgi:uncharacterized protein YecE (DUF72 family)